MKTRKKFIPKFAADNEALQTGGRKADSTYFRLRIAHKKIAYVNFLIKNVDQLVIVASLVYPVFKSGLIDRFLLLAHWSSKDAVIIFTKRDLASAEDIALARAIYEGLSCRVYVLANLPCTDAPHSSESSHDTTERREAGNHSLRPTDPSYSSNDSLPKQRKGQTSPPLSSSSANKPSTRRGDKLFFKMRQEVFAGKRSAVVGHSGVGKTALLTRIDERYRGRVSEISSFTKRGRHTTTRVTRHELDFGGEVFDMPGLKELDFTDVLKADLKGCYHEFMPSAGDCAFKNCLHDHEPNCAVREAVAAGAIHPVRYNNYLRILGTLEKY